MKRKDYTVIVITILALAVISVYTVNTSKKQKHNYIWEKTYQDGIVQPYDFGVLKALLKNKVLNNFELVEEKLKEKIEANQLLDSSAYLFVGRYCFLRRDEMDALLEFAENGHNVVMIAEGLPDTLMQTLSYYAKPVIINRFDDQNVNVETYKERSKEVNYTFNFRSFDHDTTKQTDWYFLDESKQLDYYYGQTGNRYIKAGKVNGKLNYAKFKVGSGFVFIHTSPILFTNYALRNPMGYNYVNEVFSGILGHGPLIFDIGSRNYKEDAEQIHRKSDSPLSYILKQPALKWAWYLFLSSVILFFLFKAKRKQRLIPVLEKKRNTTVNFIDTLSGLFYHDANFRQMAETRMNLFLFFIRNKLKISTQDVQADNIRQISAKSKVPEQQIKEIFDYYRKVIWNTKDAVYAENLMEFNNLIDSFYQLYNKKQ